MKVLHLYSQKRSLLANYVSQLCKYLPQDVECAVADNGQDFRKECKAFRPDIVHQHGIVSISNINSQIPILSPRYRLVLTPHGDDVFSNKAYAIIARSQMESDRIAFRRTEVVRNPIITKTTDFAEAAASMVRIYQRVMDSHPLPLMDDNTRRSMAMLLKAGICGDRRWVQNDDTAEDSDSSDKHVSTDFRRILIYAELEGVADIIRKGMTLMGITPLDVTVDCYLPEGYSVPDPMTGKSINNILSDISKNGLSMIRIVDLYKALHDDRLDEDRLSASLEQDKTKPLFQSLLQILKEQILLDEGFMPCSPIDNQLTRKLRRQLTTRLQI